MNNNERKHNSLNWLNVAFFLQQQTFILPVTLFFYLENGLTITDYLLLQSLIYIMQIILGIPFSYLADHFSKKYVLILGFCLCAIKSVLWIIFRGYYIIFIGEMLYVIARIYTTSMVDSYIYEYLHEQNGQNQSMCNKYGNVNMFMSCGTAIAVLLSPFIYKYFGIECLLSIELTVTLVGIICLCMLPKTQTYNRRILAFNEIKKALSGIYSNHSLLLLLAFNLAMYIATTLFVSSFQPLMKLTSVPVTFFGILYFCNYVIRGIFGHYAPKIHNLLTLHKTLIVSGLTITISFMAVALAFFVNSTCFTFIALFIICLGIGLQVANYIIAISEMHKYLDFKVRATGVQIFNLIGKGCGGIAIALLKQLSTAYNFSFGFIILGIMFCIASAILHIKLFSPTKFITRK